MSSDRGFRRTRFVCISDTHNQTPKLPPGDVLIHAGDLTNQGSLSELRKTVNWLEKADFEAKIVVAGNHDVTLDEPFYEQHGAYFHNQSRQSPRECIELLKCSPTITYLQHESAAVLLRKPDGPRTHFNVFGSPYSPDFADNPDARDGGKWAFQYRREDGHELWDAIPLDTDVLVTHAPPQYHRDTSAKGLPDGCQALREALWRIRPCMHVCGHRHEGRGAERVRWKIDLPMVSLLEERTDVWTDPGAGSNKQSLVDLSSKGGNPIDNDLAHTKDVESNHVSFSSPPSPTAKQTAPSGDAIPSAYANRRRLSIREDAQPSRIATGRKEDGEQLISRLDTYRLAAVAGRTGRRETCVINAAIMARSHGGPKRFNKAMVVDVDLPVRA